MSRWRLIVSLAAAMAGALPAVAADPSLLLQAEAKTLSGDCKGGGVVIEGNHNAIAVTGQCRSLLLKGIANTVRLGVVPGATIRVEGSGNRVSYTVTGNGPAIEMLGTDNEVSPGPAVTVPVSAQAPAPSPVAARPADAGTPPRPAVVAPPGTGPLILAGDDQQRLASCGGRDVMITGTRSAYVLSGGCRAVTVRGDLLLVQAEVQAGAHIAVSGRGNVVSWGVRGRGRNPFIVVQGPGSRAQRILPPGE